MHFLAELHLSETKSLKWLLPVNRLNEFPYVRIRHLEHGFESTVESFEGIVCPGEVFIGPEVNVPYIHVESRFPSCRVARFFAYKGVLKIIFDFVRNVAVY